MDGRQPFPNDLQNRLFNAFANGLNSTAAFDNSRVHPAFKDSLKKLLIRSGAEILRRQAPDGAFQDAGFNTGRRKFFGLAFFRRRGRRCGGD